MITGIFKTFTSKTLSVKDAHLPLDMEQDQNATLMLNDPQDRLRPYIQTAAACCLQEA